MHTRWIAGLFAAGTVLLGASTASASFISYIIRGTAEIQEPAPGETEFLIKAAGDKAALGSSAIDGTLLGDLLNVSIERLDDPTRFTAGSGPYVAPYLNFWITDGAGNFAVVANEPSDANFQPLYNNGYSLSFADLSNKVAKVYENSDKSWLPNNGLNLTFADLADFTILAPTVGQLTTGWAGLGTGAPREVGTNLAYGVNWVFGDTLSNYVSGDPGYRVANAAVSSVPEPSAMVLMAMAGMLLARRRLRP